MNRQTNIIPLATVTRKKKYVPTVHETVAFPEKHSAEFNHHAVERFVHRFINYLQRHSGEVSEVRLAVKDTRRTYHRKFDHVHYHEFVFGLKTLEWVFTNHYREYATIKHHIKGVGNRKFGGWEAIYYVVIHEFAHALQVEKQGRRPGIVHDRCFVECMNRLLTVFTFDEIAALFIPVSVPDYL